jgi:CDP-diacylglycerol--glycerol-3-phosphate 3-phosphatidyltransferase
MSIRAHFPHAIARLVGPLGRGLARLGVPPNVLTTLGLLLTVAAAASVAFGRPVLAGILLIGGGAMDVLDGAVARSGGRSTPFGGFYDSVSDRISDGVILAGIAWSVTDRPRLLLLTLVALVAAEVTSYVRARAESIDLECEVGLLERAERALLLVVGLLAAPLFEPVLWVLAIGGSITVVQRVHHVWCQIERDLPEELLALAHADRAWSRAFVRTARAFYGERNFDEAFGGGLDEVLGEGLTERLRERLSNGLRAGADGRVGAAVRRVRRAGDHDPVRMEAAGTSSVTEELGSAGQEPEPGPGPGPGPGPDRTPP